MASKIYTTRAGDMWDSIAFQQLGSTSETGRLMDLNQEYRNLYIFPSGVTLTLPEPVTVKTASTLPPWKQKG